MERIKELLKALKKLERKEVTIFVENGKIVVKFLFDAGDLKDDFDFYFRFKGIKGDELITKAVRHLLKKELEKAYEDVRNTFNELEKLLKEVEGDEPEEAF